MQLSEFFRQNFGVRKVDKERTMRFVRRLGYRTLDAFLEVENPEKLEKHVAILKNLALKHNTFFLRDPEFWRYCERLFFANLPRNRKTDILSLGCSNGREPATILLEAFRFVEPEYLHVEAWDISPAMVERAADPVFNSSRIDCLNLPKELRKRFIRQTPTGRCRLSQEALDCLEVNLGDARVPEQGEPEWFKPGHYSMVFCRYMLVHLVQAEVDKLYPKIAQALDPAGKLGFLGVGNSDPKPPGKLFAERGTLLYQIRVDTAAKRA